MKRNADSPTSGGDSPGGRSNSIGRGLLDRVSLPGYLVAAAVNPEPVAAHTALAKTDGSQ
jgi:hypothetical protein